MSLYNALHGMNPNAQTILAILKSNDGNINWDGMRFRDISLNEDGSQIILYTRNGGGNREHYGDNKGTREGFECPCHGCFIKYHIPKHPEYLKDVDDEYDTTYAAINFSTPSSFLAIARNMSTGEKPKSIGQKFEETINKIKSGDKESMEKAKNIFGPFMEEMMKDFKKEK